MTDADPTPPAGTTRPARRRWLRRALGVAGVVLAAMLGGWVALFVTVDAEALPGALPPQAGVTTAAPFPKQGPNQCGGFSTAYGVGLLGRDVEPAAMVARVCHTVGWSEGLTGALPWKILATLDEEGLDRSDYTARSFPAARRLDLLRAHLAEGRPLLTLIESERGTQHYVLVVGYGPATIDLYDPNAEAEPAAPERTRDLNGARPGNRTLKAAEFQTLWSRGGIVGLFGWWYVPLREGGS